MERAVDLCLPWSLSPRTGGRVMRGLMRGRFDLFVAVAVVCCVLSCYVLVNELTRWHLHLQGAFPMEL